MSEYGPQPGQQPPAYGQQPFGAPVQEPSLIPAEVQIASMPRRLAARLIDVPVYAVLFSIVGFMIGIFLNVTGIADFPTERAVVDEAADAAYYQGVARVSSLVIPLYEIVMVAIVGGTVGKKLLGVKVVRVADGQTPGWGPAVVRCLIAVAGSIACGIGLVLVCLSPFFDSTRHRQGWADKAAKTVVIRPGQPVR